jgi:hypothetical protein
LPRHLADVAKDGDPEFGCVDAHHLERRIHLLEAAGNLTPRPRIASRVAFIRSRADRSSPTFMGHRKLTRAHLNPAASAAPIAPPPMPFLATAAVAGHRAHLENVRLVQRRDLTACVAIDDDATASGAGLAPRPDAPNAHVARFDTVGAYRTGNTTARRFATAGF